MRRLRSLRGRTVLITGAAGGIGRALARQLSLDEGARLILADKEVDGLRGIAEELLRVGADVVTHQADLRSRSSLEALAAAVSRGPLDVLINNAGVVFGHPFAQTSPEEIDATIEVNLGAVLHLTRLLLPRIAEGGGGFIVNLASAGGLAGAGGMCAYAASKFGVVGFSEALRAELRGQGIGVSAICPAFVRTEILKNSAASLGQGGEGTEALGRLVARLGVTPEAVAQAAIGSIKRDQGIVVVGLAPRLLLLARAHFPGLTARLNHLVYRSLRAGGMVR